MASSIDRLQPLASAAEVLQLSPSTLRRWLRRGRIHGHTLDTAPWGDVLDFTTAPTTYFRVSEVLADASHRLAAVVSPPPPQPAPPPPGAEHAYEVLSGQVTRQLSAVEAIDTKLGVAVAALIAVTGAIYAAQPPRIFAALLSGWVLVALVQAFRGFRYDTGYTDGVNAKFLDERMHLQLAEIKRRSLAVLKVAEQANQDRLDRKGRLLTQVTFTLVLVIALGLIGKVLGLS